MTQKKSSSGKKGKKPTLSSATADSGSAANKAADNAAQNAADSAKKGATDAKEKSQAATSNVKSNANTSSPSTNSQAHRDGKPSGGWIAPVALLFGLAGTGFSAYLWSQLKSFNQSTSLQLQSQAEQAKTGVSGIKTELDEKAAALTGLLEEKTGALSAALDTKTTELAQSLDATTNELTQALDEKTSALDEKVVSLGETLRTEASDSKTEIATTTASAVQELTTKTELEINNISTSFNTGLALQKERSGKRFDDIELKVSELDESVKTTNELASRGQRDWVLAEVNYLLRTGVHRVKLAGDVKAGVIALESASDRLHTLGDIDYLPVREQIAEEVAALRRVGPPDIEGLIFKLEHMSKRADSLPLPPSEMQKAKEALKEDPAAASVSLGKSLLERLNFSYDVSESAEPRKPRSRKAKPTKEQLTASDSLRLHLQAARLSALRHDSENFTNHMDNAIGYSEQIFDQDDNRVTTYISDLSDLRETAIVPRIPALGSSLSLFTKIDSKRGSQ